MGRSSRFFRRRDDRIGLLAQTPSKLGIAESVWKSLPGVASGTAVLSAILLATMVVFRSGIVVEPFSDGGDSELKAAAFTPRLAASIAEITRVGNRSNISAVTAQIDGNENIDIKIGGQTLNLDSLVFSLSKYVGTAKIISGDVYKTGNGSYGSVMQFNGIPISGAHVSADLAKLIDQLALQIVACSNPILFADISLSASAPNHYVAIQTALDMLLNCDGSIRDRDRAEFSTALSLVYQELGDLERANNELEQAVYRGYHNAGLWAEYSLRAYFNGSYQIALRAAEEALTSPQRSEAYTKTGLSAKVALATAIRNELIGSYKSAADFADSYIRDEANEYDRFDAYWWMRNVNLIKAGEYASLGSIHTSDPRLLQANDRGHPKLLEGWAEYGHWISVAQNNWADALKFSVLQDRIHSCAEPKKEVQRLLMHSSAIRILSAVSGQAAEPTIKLSNFLKTALETCYPCVRASGYEALLSNPPNLNAAHDYFSKAIDVAKSLPFAYVERGYVALKSGSDAKMAEAEADFLKAKSLAPEWSKDRISTVKDIATNKVRGSVVDLFKIVWASDKVLPKADYMLKPPDTLSSDLEQHGCHPAETFFAPASTK